MGLLTQQDPIGIAGGLNKVLRGTAVAHIGFGDLRSMLAALGFDERIKGREAALNLQPDCSKAKAYQVKQVRQIIIEHKAGER